MLEQNLDQKLNCVIGINGRDVRLNVIIGGRNRTLSVFIKGDYVPKIGQQVRVVPVNGAEGIVSIYGLKGYDVFAVQKDGEQIPFAHARDV